jgi:hypothetical protein
MSESISEGDDMFSRTFAVGFAVCLWVFPAFVFGQGAAEYGAIAGSSASMAVKAGTVLNRSTNRAAEHIGKRIAQPSQAAVAKRGRRRSAKDQSRVAGMHTDSTHRAPIASVMGDEAASYSDSAKGCSVPSGTKLRSTKCQHEKPNQKPQNKYPSTVSISFGH